MPEIYYLILKYIFKSPGKIYKKNSTLSEPVTQQSISLNKDDGLSWEKGTKNIKGVYKLNFIETRLKMKSIIYNNI